MIRNWSQELAEIEIVLMACIPNSPSNEMNIFTDSNEKKTCILLCPGFYFMSRYKCVVNVRIQL